jgi:hypothetical protein
MKQTNDIHFFTDNLPLLSPTQTHTHTLMCICASEILRRDIIRYQQSVCNVYFMHVRGEDCNVARRMKNFYCNMKRGDFVVAIL